MVIKLFSSILSTFLAVATFQVSAAIISIDYQSPGDNLITQDTVTGIEWLDLTETNSLSYNFVSGQLGASGQFEGWRYATSQEVVVLWSNFGINLQEGETTFVAGTVDPNIISAVTMIGNIFPENQVDSPWGALGVTSDSSIGPDHRNLMGAWYVDGTLGITGNEYRPLDYMHLPVFIESAHIGSYLVRDVSTVPIPSAVWLFGSGLIGLIGIARRKNA